MSSENRKDDYDDMYNNYYKLGYVLEDVCETGAVEYGSDYEIADLAKIITSLYLLDEITKETWSRFENNLLAYAKMEHENFGVWYETNTDWKLPCLRNLIPVVMEVLLQDSKLKNKNFKTEQDVFDYLNGLDFNLDKQWLYEIYGYQGVLHGDQLFFIEKTEKAGREATCFKTVNTNLGHGDWKIKHAQRVLSGITDIKRLNGSLLCLSMEKADWKVIYDMDRKVIVNIESDRKERKQQVGKFLVDEKNNILARGMPVNAANFDPHKAIIHAGLKVEENIGSVFFDLSENCYMINLPACLPLSRIEEVKKEFGLEEEVVELMYQAQVLNRAKNAEE